MKQTFSILIYWVQWDFVDDVCTHRKQLTKQFLVMINKNNNYVLGTGSLHLSLAKYKQLQSNRWKKSSHWYEMFNNVDRMIRTTIWSVIHVYLFSTIIIIEVLAFVNLSKIMTSNIVWRYMWINIHFCIHTLSTDRKQDTCSIVFKSIGNPYEHKVLSTILSIYEDNDESIIFRIEILFVINIFFLVKLLFVFRSRFPVDLYHIRKSTNILIVRYLRSKQLPNDRKERQLTDVIHNNVVYHNFTPRKKYKYAKQVSRVWFD